MDKEYEEVINGYNKNMENDLILIVIKECEYF